MQIYRVTRRPNEAPAWIEEGKLYVGRPAAASRSPGVVAAVILEHQDDPNKTFAVSDRVVSLVWPSH